MTAALRRAAASHLVVLVAALALGAGLAGAALVGFSADVQNKSSTFAGGWLAAPTNLQTPTPAGNGATLAWTPSTHALTGQALVGTDEGTTASCSGATYSTSFATGIAATATSYTDDRGAGASGHWICYQVQSTRDSWTKGASFAIVQVGLVPTGIAVANGGTSGQISNGDTITLGFDQAVQLTDSSNVTVCAFAAPANTILIGDSGCASSGDTPSIGKLTGLSIPSGSASFPSSTVGASGNAVTITLGGGSTGTAVSGTGTFAYTSTSTTIQSTAGAANVCTAPNCTWAYSGAF